MFVIRQALPDDVPTLLKLARMVHFINLPADADIIAAKVARSARSFAGERVPELERQFMFVLEDTESGGVVGTSSLICRMGSPEAPQVFLQVRRREHFSRDLNTGAVHTTIQVQTDGSGPSELGGLILAPGYRGHREKLGSLLSLVRFHFLALHRAQFQPRIIAELMGPLTPDSNTLFWEFFGRRFINLSYAEADAFCQHSKEFMLSLLPREEIYLSTLPAEARNLVGKVGADTRPAKAMLEKQGFGYHDRCDPFDGGPYLEAKVDEIPLVRGTRSMRLAAGEPAMAGLGSAAAGGAGSPGAGSPGARGAGASTGFVSCAADPKLGFRAVRTSYSAEGDAIRLPSAAASAIGAREGCAVGLTSLGAGA